MPDVTLAVEPIYGWGWFASDGVPVAVPAPFSLLLQSGSEQAGQGRVLDPSHAFVGLEVSISKRHVEWDGYVNVEVHGDGCRCGEITGYASVATVR